MPNNVKIYGNIMVEQFDLDRKENVQRNASNMTIPVTYWQEVSDGWQTTDERTEVEGRQEGEQSIGAGDQSMWWRKDQ